VPGTFSPVPELNLLKGFYDTQDDFFAHGFEMYGYGDGYSTSGGPEPAARLVDFAQANGSGSTYGLWLGDGRADPAGRPVVAAGDEGGLHLVARDVREFLVLLASLPVDAEPHIDWASFDVMECGWAVDNTAYLAWLDRTFGLAPVADWRSVVERARAEYGAEWTAWSRPILPDAVGGP
jgi:hypothetical protein